MHFLPLKCGEHLYGRRPLRSKGFFTYNADYDETLGIMATGAMDAVRGETRLRANQASPNLDHFPNTA